MVKRSPYPTTRDGVCLWRTNSERGVFFVCNWWFCISAHGFALSTPFEAVLPQKRSDGNLLAECITTEKYGIWCWDDLTHPMPLREDNVRNQLWQLWVYFNFLDTNAWVYNNIQFPWLGNRSVGSLPGWHSRFGKWGVGNLCERAAGARLGNRTQ